MAKDFKGNNTKTIEDSMKVVEEVTSRMNNGGPAPSQEEMEELKAILMQLLEHLLCNPDDKDIDKLISVLAIFLRLARSPDQEKDQDREKDEEEQRLDKEQKEIKKRFIIYEIYKIINPHRIAGETNIANFINNVMLRGVREALKYNPDIASKITKNQVKKLEGVQGILSNPIRENGHKGGRSF